MYLKMKRLSVHFAICSLIVAGSLIGYTAQASDVGREWDRGCSDAKGGSYDRSKHSDAYESGWQSCTKGD